MKQASIISLFLVLAACGGGGASIGPIDLSGTQVPGSAVGGAWVGTDGDGLQIFALTTDSGRLHWVAPDTGEQGFGIISSQSDSVDLYFDYVAPLGFTLADGSTIASCTGSGTIQERNQLIVITNCLSRANMRFGSQATLTYDPLYDRDSSLALIAGNYDDSGLVVNVNANGEVFEQDPATGCVINGQISIIDSQFNAYDVSITYSNCLGDAADLNGATFTGLGILDDTAAPETAIIALVGTVGDVIYSAVYVLPRI